MSEKMHHISPEDLTIHPSMTLGSGGAGNVYRGTLKYTRGEKPVAVKVLDNLDSNDIPPEFELHNRAQKSPGVCKALGYCKHQGKHCMVLALYEKSLRKYSNEREAAHPLSEVLCIAKQLADAVLSLHTEARIAHFDIKPDNILLGSKGDCFITDFSIAKIIPINHTTIPLPQDAYGSAHYMAPEQVSSKSGGIGFAADSWGLACTILEIATKRTPFPAELQLIDVMKMLEQGKGPVVPDTLDPRLAHIIKLSLNISPSKRQPVKALRSSLSQLQEILRIEQGGVPRVPENVATQADINSQPPSNSSNPVVAPSRRDSTSSVPSSGSSKPPLPESPVSPPGPSKRPQSAVKSINSAGLSLQSQQTPLASPRPTRSQQRPNHLTIPNSNSDAGSNSQRASAAPSSQVSPSGLNNVPSGTSNVDQLLLGNPSLPPPSPPSTGTAADMLSHEIDYLGMDNFSVDGITASSSTTSSLHVKQPAQRHGLTGSTGISAPQHNGAACEHVVLTASGHGTLGVRTLLRDHTRLVKNPYDNKQVTGVAIVPGTTDILQHLPTHQKAFREAVVTSAGGNISWIDVREGAALTTKQLRECRNSPDAVGVGRSVSANKDIVIVGTGNGKLLAIQMPGGGSSWVRANPHGASRDQV